MVLQVFNRKKGAALPAALLYSLAVFWGLALFVAGIAKAEILLEDAAGRKVRLEAPASRIVTNESLLLLSLALLDPEPVARLAGWAAPQRFDKGMYQDFKQRFPQIDTIPVVGGVMPANSSVEALLSVQPDLFLISLWQPGWENIAERIEAAGVPVIYLDGPENAARGPADATAFSMTLLGKAIGRDEQASSFADFVKVRYAFVAERLKNISTKQENTPKVLIDAHAVDVCCASPGLDNRITQYLTLAGGNNIGSDVIAGYDGQLSPEYVLSIDPDVYIATGGPHLAGQGGLVIGGDMDKQAARASLRAVTQRSIRGDLTSIRDGRAFAVSHQFSNSALSVLVFECFAKWIHPALFEDLEPADTLAEINRRFMAVPITGTFWVSLNETQKTATP
ncbi:ABC transporter substrate-binding protein [Pseudochrobactrum kiredjianiae]|uniref:ABC transporter substrate-binding protein n=1 Tax=Pseudochrobactrum kiredjianiae TaxID=386305 RepID=A0ABW3V0G3_9HYPH|nr:ABC transporter substrate-binding protein [Pseudochrobactrum kiredjianiae]MDM7853122.1 ABC transporter substrate-binding protein [Pseudochrobactrum kiredjianiae]